MLRITCLLLSAILLCSSANTQRYLQTVLQPVAAQQQNVAFNGKVLIAGHGDPFLLSYDDVGFTSLEYPIVGGVRLRFDSYKNPLTLFQSAVFFSLRATPGTYSTGYLYRFNGSTFSRITITGVTVSNCIVYGDHLYFLARSSEMTRLYRYSAGTVTEVAGGSVPNSFGYELYTAGGNLYITGHAGGPGTANFIRRFNGSVFFTLPYSGPGANVNGVYAVPGTARVYFTSHERIIYFNGSTVTQVFYNTGESIVARMWRNSLYFTTATGGEPARNTYLYRLSGATLTLISLPGGAVVAPVPQTNPEIYNDQLYIGAVSPDGSKKVLRYDGVTFWPFFDITGFAGSGIWLFLREGNLMIQPNFANGNNAFEYNGSVFTEIIAPAERLLFPYINSTACNHLWLNYYNDKWEIKWAYAKEKKDCPPPPPASVIVIPEHFRDYERFDFTTYGPERGWCWSDIIIDWEIVPICPLPPCPSPNYDMRMMDANNGLAWYAKFNKPSALSVPLPDQQSYQTILSSTDAKKDLLIFEPNLVPMGIATIKLNMKPKQSYFLLSATTRNNAVVPLKVTLLNAKGTAIWQETFTAPFSKQISATVQEPGQQLVFSVPEQGANLITRKPSGRMQVTGASKTVRHHLE